VLLLDAVSGSIARFDDRLNHLPAIASVRLGLRPGYLKRGTGLMAYAAWRYRLLGGAERTLRYVEIAQQLSSADGRFSRYRTWFLYCSSLRPWFEPRREAADGLRCVEEAALECGDREYVNFARSLRAYIRAVSGTPLSDVIGELPEQTRAPLGLLLGRPDALLERARILEQAERALADAPQLMRHARTLWMLALCVLDDPAAVLEQAHRSGDPPASGTLEADWRFYRALAAAALLRALDDPTPPARWAERWLHRLRGRHGRSARALRRQFREDRRRLLRWARRGSDFLHMAQFIEAERAWLRGRWSSALRLYEQTSHLALQRGYLHHAALAQQRQAGLLRSLRRETEAARARSQSVAHYQQWGAHACVPPASDLSP